MKRLFLWVPAALLCAAPAHAETFRERYDAIVEDLEFNDYMIGIATDKAKQGNHYASCEALNLAVIGFTNNYNDMDDLANDVDEAGATDSGLPDLHAEADVLEGLMQDAEAKYEENCG